MNNLNDMEKFDSIFRNAASDYELSYSEDSWILMQEKLDATLTQKKRRGIWWWFPIALIAVGAGAGIYIYEKQTNYIVSDNISNNLDNQNTNKKETNTNNISKNATEEKVINDKNYTESKSELKEITTIKPVKEIATKKSIIINDRQSSTTDIKQSISIKKGATVAIVPKQNDAILINKSNEAGSKKTDIANNQINSNNKKATTKNSVIIDNTLKTISNASSSNTYTANILYMHNRYIPNFKQLEKDNIVIAAKREEENKRNIEEEKSPMICPITPGLPTSSDWFLTAYFASNIGYVSNPRISNTHLQYQIGFGYNINRNLSLQTGIAFGNRTFDMKKDQFSYKGPGAYEKYIRNINADISVIDIPITLRYQFADKENFGWFTTLGISTVYSKTENYIITIDNGPTPSYLYQNFENTASWLSMLNLSVGYQYPLSKKITLTAEPYIQLPFKTIGEGGSKLCSVGLQIGTKYNFLKKKK